MEYKYSESEIANVASDIIKQSVKSNIWLLYGGMGAGKTTLVKHLVRSLGSNDEVSSPTFALVNEYKIHNPVNEIDTIYHFDLYRLKNIEELYDVGIEEYLAYNKAIVIIEWPDLAKPFIQKPYLAFSIEVVDDTNRLLTITEHK